MTIEAEKVKAEVGRLSKKDKNEIKKQLEEISYEDGKEELFAQLKNAKTADERNLILTEHKDIFISLRKADKDDALVIIAEQENREYDFDTGESESEIDEDTELFGEASSIDTEALRNSISDYKRRREKEKEEKTKIKEISTTEISEEILEQAIKDAQASRLLTVKDDWMSLFNRICWENTTPGEILFHVFMGQLLKYITVYDGDGKMMRLKLDFFWVQNSSTGKGEAFDSFFKPIVDGIQYDEIIAETGQTLGRELVIAPFKGQSTLAGMLNRYKRDNKKGKYTNEVIIGPLQASDFWIWTEADDLLTPNSYSSHLMNALLDLMEGKPYDANLEKYDLPIRTTATGSLVASSRPAKNIEYFFIRSGLIHRCLVYMRDVEEDMFRAIVTRGGAKSYGTRVDNTTLEVDKEKLISKLNDIASYANQFIGRDYPVNNPDLLNALTSHKLNELMRDTRMDVKVKVYRDTLLEYISRMRNKSIILSYQNAIIRKAPLDVEDVVNAFDMLSKCYVNLKYWLFENINLEKKYTEKESRIYALIKAKIKKSPSKECSLQELKDAIEEQRDLNLSGNYVYNKINQVIRHHDDIFERDKKIVRFKKAVKT